MVSLLIFAMLSAAGIALLSFSVRAQGAANDALRDVSALRRVNALLSADLAQAVPRPYRDRAGAARPAFGGDAGAGGAALGLVRGGWSNPDGRPRASLQRVEYRLAADRLERVAWPHVDGAEPLPPAVLLTGVSGLRLRYRVAGAWADRWTTPSPTPCRRRSR
jgi:general secretion pathway protein J